jgi:hypothetical protein
VTYVSTEGSYFSPGSLQDIGEEFEYSHLTFYASYAPSFNIFENRTTYAFLYMDVGASASVVSMSYFDQQIDYLEGFRVDSFFEYEINEKVLPGYNIGIGFVINYKLLGLHIGVQYEGLYEEAFGGLINTAYPMVGLTIR